MLNTILIASISFIMGFFFYKWLLNWGFRYYDIYNCPRCEIKVMIPKEFKHHFKHDCSSKMLVNKTEINLYNPKHDEET